jgi:uncharacterized protein YecT (DUF1311 family)
MQLTSKLAGAITFALIAASASAAENCKNPQSQLAMNTCAAQDYKREDVRLNKNYQGLMAKTEKGQQAKLKALQLAWIKFRDLKCDYESAQYEGGTIYPFVQESCLAEMTRQRNKDLKAMLEEAAM